MLEKLVMKNVEVNKFTKLFLLLVILVLNGCLPKHEIKEQFRDDSNVTSEVTDNDNNNSTSTPGQLAEVNNFLQQGVTKTTTTLNLFADFNDTFLMRGNNLIAFLAEAAKTSQSSYCLVTNFTGSYGANAKNVVVMSASVRSYYSTTLNTKEYFLQIEPNNKEKNQLDCLTVSLNNTLSAEYGTTNFAYAIEDICPSCNINITSESLKVYNSFGAEITDIQAAHLYLNLIPSIGSSSGSNASCSVNANCTSQGYNCCLAGQCVNHGELKPGISTTDPSYLVALQIVSARPELIKNYENIFYVCPSMIPTDTNNNGSGDPDDPYGQAADLFEELTDLYNCLTPVIDEFSVCKVDFQDASELMSAAPNNFYAGVDDITFSSINPALNGENIVKVKYAGKFYYKEKLFDTDTEVNFLPSYGTLSFGSSNDSLDVGQYASIQIPVPSDATNDILSLYYKVDGTCEKLGQDLARCTKSYVQGQNAINGIVRSSDHSSGYQSFALPSYADTSFNIIVKVGGSVVTSSSETWQLSGNNVVFNANSFPIYNNQTVDITYFVTQNVGNLTLARSIAQAKVDEHCACDPNEEPCWLKPVVTESNGVSTVTSYVCIYPEPDLPEPPLQETVYISAKAVPHKFFDVDGVNYNLGEIGSAFEQEGQLFEYNDGNKLKPNNTTTSKGFNEIYGSMNQGAASPVPPTVLTVKKGTTYDIFVDEGAFSTCLNCGTDYFSSMQKIFPNNFEWRGAGYFPDMVESRRRENMGDFNGDDMRFGRACFLPATMIPWTHKADADVTEQRQSRLAAQHFLFANGYNKDWFGFDYASIIGSFDGVTWFAIGSQRKITAKSNKLYIAVNAYFGDLTINNTFKVTVSEIANVLNSGSLITNDLESDGAQCQKAHICSKDEDCIAQLGYDYTCQNINTLVTQWPNFDNNGNEISGSTLKTIASLVGGSNGESKRCIYRGVGSICEQASHSVQAVNSYTQTNQVAFHQCAPNASCVPLSSSSFNDRIARFAESPAAQNIQSFITDKTDTFGLGARILGRPYDYYGNRTPAGTIQSHLQAIDVNALCVPGVAPEYASTTEELNHITISNRESDIINNVGRTLPIGIAQDDNYFSACPATDDEGNYTHFQNVDLDDSSHQPFAIRNNLSTNSLLVDSFDPLNLFNDEGTLVTTLGYHKNTCLRAPGAKCFSDFECAPNSFISTKVKSLTSVNGDISEAERDFWEEDLVCANSQPRYIPGSNNPNPLYQTYEHHCCRETGKSFTYYSQQHEGSDFKVIDSFGTPLIPGVNQDIDDPQRYSRTHTVYDKLISEPTKYPPLVSATPQPVSRLNLSASTVAQYNTLHLNNSRMCCTGHWVREFASGSNGNGGGHQFLPTKQQNYNVSILKPLSWNPNNVPPLNNFGSGYNPIPFSCTAQDYLTADCEVKNISAGSSFEENYLGFLGKLELLGIPQVLVETNDTIYKPISTTFIDTDGDGTDDIAPQDDISSLKLPLDNTIKDVNTGEGKADIFYNNQEYYSAAAYDNFEIGSGKLKKVFSEDSFNCCIPAGIQVDQNTPNESCCTGQAYTDTNNGNIRKCCLKEFTNVSVYTNRYVSSEGAYFNGQPVSDSDIDATTGFIKKEIVYQMAQTMCCTGKAGYGVAIGNYLIPVSSSYIPDNATRRFLYDPNIDDLGEPAGGHELFSDWGLRWNHHVYCMPDSLDGGGSGGGGAGAIID